MTKPIGNIKTENPFFLAPLAGITDRSFRTLCQRQGASLVYSEMISAKGMVYKDKGTEKILLIGDEEKNVGYQIFGSDPAIMAEATHMLEERRNCLIDVNFGCPVPKVVKNGEGSALLKKPDQIYKIIKTMVAATEKPVTGKIRIGWDFDTINCIEVSKALEEAGASAVAVHGRTRTQMYTGKATREHIKNVKDAVSIPVIASGDIFTGREAIDVLGKTGCDYIMIARGALGNPWIFKEAECIMKGKEYKPPDIQDKIGAMVEHLKMLIEDKGERVAVCEMRKHTGWYLKGVPGAAAIRREINGVKSAEEYLKTLEILCTLVNDVRPKL